MSEPEVTREACTHVINRLYAFHDEALSEEEAAEIRHHLMACEPCLDDYDVEQAMRELIRRCCNAEHAPDALRLKLRATYSHTVVVAEGD